MTEASHVAGIAPFTTIVCPFCCLLLQKLDCDGIILTILIVWISCLYALLGFCPGFNIILLSLADGIVVSLMSTMSWQVLVVLCPASYVGSLSGVVYSLRNFTTALVFIAAGYMLQRGNMTDKDEAVHHYQHMFIMLLILSATGIIIGVVMNVMDIRKGGALNTRIRKWQQSNVENIELISKTEPSSEYGGNSDTKDSDDF
ncbi:uncharacterized protein LOC117327309 [Pecten maximus]|uniref:uncharacterized protein LOC117327309 n=1 Tax=Pecten maximus TaxID=6579 RepID=UPI0014590035|nr:uncharacterized protein LOC117327309 [Pecten maximus]